MKLVGYIRVSRVGGPNGDSFISPDVQKQAITAHAKANGHRIVKWVEDLDESGKRSRRRLAKQLGLAIVMGGLIVVAIASFGSVAYAASSKVVKVQLAPSSSLAANSAADAQYEEFLPPKAPKVAGVVKTTAAPATAPSATKPTLPFTGLALWVPMALGIGLIAVGLGLRTRGRRRNSSA